MTGTARPQAPETLQLRGVAWPEIREGDDLVTLLSGIEDLRAGDVLVVTSKVLSKSEGRLVHGHRAREIASQTRRVVARRGATVIAETPLGLVMAAAGVDASNTPSGTVLLLPLDPDASARALRSGIYATTGLNVAVVVSDTAGRAWRVGQTDLAVGCAGLEPVHDLQGTYDTHGNQLMVTAAAVADELASAADLVKAKTSQRPVAVVRGMSAAVLPAGEDGPGAHALIRNPAIDFFGLGAREAVVAAALRTDLQALEHFPDPGTDLGPFLDVVDGWLGSLPATRRAQVLASLAPVACREAPDQPAWELQVAVRDDAADVLVAVGRLLERGDALAAAHRLAGHSPPPPAAAAPWRRTFARCWHPR